MMTRKTKRASLWPLLLIAGFVYFEAPAQQGELSYRFDRHYGQVEVGGRFVGAEFHGSRPLPSRISFYYPVANSIDLSTDYWKRDASRPVVIGLRIGSGTRQWIGKEGWTYVLSPHRVQFSSTKDGLASSLKYEFCLTEPAMVVTFTTVNRSSQSIPLEVYTHLKLSLRTCQTYAWKDTAQTRFYPKFSAIAADFDASDADRASVFVENAGEPPSSWTTSASQLGVADSGGSDWIQQTGDLGGTVLPAPGGVPVAAFAYRKTLAPGDSISVVQIVGSCRRSEVREKLERLAAGWKSDLDAYDDFVRLMAGLSAHFTTGDSSLDRSAEWARGLLASNQHYLDGTIIPMPCPAEYNFFFTHDLLLTNLGAVNFDLDRVKRNLLYLASHARDSIIPHAYYWRDDGYKTEYCTPENWNHLWFIIVTASYLRHSDDDSTGTLLYPLVTKSLSEVLTQRHSDGLMYSYRPDWWDIGHVEGPRAYLTILTIRALRDYEFITTAIGRGSRQLLQYDQLADSLRHALVNRLWDPHLKYLINYNAGRKDTHVYMGSLLAPVYGVLDSARSRELVNTAREHLLRKPVGIMVAAPADFNTDSMRTWYKFAGNEAGDPYLYINGGIWPHANAVYALALRSTGRSDEAIRFVKSTMTLDGVARSPEGIPAMYEYRFSDTSSPEFGRIDKPSFLWAAGFYLDVLYRLFGFEDNEWNVSIDAPLPSGFDSLQCTFSFGGSMDAVVSGRENRIAACSVDGDRIPSAVLPLTALHRRHLRVSLGGGGGPYLAGINAILRSVTYDEGTAMLSIVTSSFEGHGIGASFLSPSRPRRVTVDGAEISRYSASREPDGMYRILVPYQGQDWAQRLSLQF